MTTEDKYKDELKKAVPSKKWAEMVDKMRPNEVTNVYIHLRTHGKLRK